MQFPRLKRREIITLLGGATAWPLAVRAQQPKIPVIGLLTVTPPQLMAHLIDAFRQDLSELDYIEGRNVAFEYRTARFHDERFEALATELVRSQVSMIFVTAGMVAARAAKAATATIPILFYTSGDPVAQGLIASFARPGGNVTGMGWLGKGLAAKRFELLRELLPKAALVGVLAQPNDPDREFELAELQRAADGLGLEVQIFNAADDADFGAIFPALIERRVSALLVTSNPHFSSRRGRIVALAGRYGVPTIYDRREFPDAGGLISYGSLRADAYHQLGIYAGRILKGAKPADLPAFQPTKFELVINLNAAKVLGLEVPPTLLARADEVID
jgi:putative tryptophan/tyrosine transport system substrate-binding protein